MVKKTAFFALTLTFCALFFVACTQPPTELTMSMSPLMPEYTVEPITEVVLTTPPQYVPDPTQTFPTSVPVPDAIVTGTVADGRYPYGSQVGISGATVSYQGLSTATDGVGHFSLAVSSGATDPLLEITAPGFMPYREKPSHMVNGAFYLIPKTLYQGVYLVLGNPESSNPHRWLRKWEEQTEFVIVRTSASKQQIGAVLILLTSDEYGMMTGGRFTSSGKPNIVDQKPTGSDRLGKTVISFAPNIVRGGIAHSEDTNGVINYAEITWDVTQKIDRVVFWHEMFHTVTAGGHINEWPSVVSENATTGYVTETDQEILNIIYNSPPGRGQPN